MGGSVQGTGDDAAAGKGHRLAARMLMPLLAALAALALFWLVHTPMAVRGESMEPGIAGGDRLAITRGYRNPERGDVIAFRFPDGQVAIKRVVALPGDQVYVSGHAISVNGTWDREPALAAAVRSVPVPDGTVFVAGDNRGRSVDSRRIGPVPLGEIQGRVVVRWGPVHRITVFGR